MTLRAGETATLHVQLVVGSEKTEVTVFGTSQGVRADPQIGVRLDSAAIDESRSSAARSRPCRCSTPRSARARAREISSLTRRTSSRARAADARRPSCSTGRATTKVGAGRRCWPRCRLAPWRRSRSSPMLSPRNWLDRRPGPQHRDQIRHERTARRSALHGAAGIDGRRRDRPCHRRLLCAVGAVLHDPGHAHRDQPGGRARRLGQVSGSIGGAIVKDRTFFFASGDYTRQDRTTFLSPALPAFVLPADGSLTARGPLPAGTVQCASGPQADAGADGDGPLQRRPHVRHQSERRGRRNECSDGCAQVHAAVLVDAGQSHGRPALEPPQ